MFHKKDIFLTENGVLIKHAVYALMLFSCADKEGASLSQPEDYRQQHAHPRRSACHSEEHAARISRRRHENVTRELSVYF